MRQKMGENATQKPYFVACNWAMMARVRTESVQQVTEHVQMRRVCKYRYVNVNEIKML